MTEPAIEAPPSRVPVVLRILLVVICLLPAAVGLILIASTFGAFIYEGWRFKPVDEVWMQLFIGLGAVLVLLPAIVIGIVLRFARWKRAPGASLVLAAIVGATGALASGMLQTTVVPGDTEAYVLLTMSSIAGVAIGAVPPFLHWWDARGDA